MAHNPKTNVIKYRPYVEKYSAAYSLDPNIVAALIMTESQFDPNARNYNPETKEGTSASGLGQIVKKTWDSLKYKHSLGNNVMDPEMNIKGTCAYLREQANEFGGRVNYGLAAYLTGAHDEDLNRYYKKNPNASLEELDRYMLSHSKVYRDNTQKEGKGYLNVIGYYAQIKGNYNLTSSARSTARSTATSPYYIPPNIAPDTTLKSTSEPDIPNIPYDSKIITPYDDEYSSDFFKIGDVVLKVPPQNISIHESNIVYTFETVRTRSDPKLRTGNAQMNITVDCMFADTDNINGFWDGKRYYGGLRSMIAQYYMAPFLPIENALIRNTIVPEAEAMKNEGWEGNVEGLSKYIDDQLKIVESIKDNISKNNTPEKSAKYVESYVNNMITKLNDTRKSLEEDYRKRQQRAADENTDRLAKDHIWGTTDTPANTYQDMQVAVVLDSFSISTVPGFPKSLRAMFNLRPFNYAPYSSNFWFIRSEDDCREQIEYYKSVRAGKTDVKSQIMPTANISESEIYKKYYRSIISDFQDGLHDGNDSVYEVDSSAPILYKYSGDPTSEVSFTYNYVNESRKSLMHQELLSAQAELNILKNSGLRTTSSMSYNWIPIVRIYRTIAAAASYIDNSITQVEDILRNNLKGDVKSFIYDLEHMKWNEIDKVLDSIKDIENKDKFLSDVDKYISTLLGKMGIARPYASNKVMLAGTTDDGNDIRDRVITGITATYNNKVTPIKILGHDYPTFQYMGGSDVNMTISMQTTNEDFLSQLRLLSIRSNFTQLLNAHVRRGALDNIVDTSAAVKGELFELLGVKNVIVTDVSYSNVEGNPGLYSITINCVQSDMDINKYEALVGTAFIDLNIMTRVVGILRGNEVKWNSGSVWERYHDSITNIDTTLSDLQKESERIRNSKYDDLVSVLQRIYVNTLSMGIFPILTAWYNLTNKIGLTNIDDPDITRKLFRMADTVVLEKSKSGERVNTYQVLQNIKRSISNATELAQLRDDELTRMINNNKDNIAENRNQCYVDMGLPLITDTRLSTPADFYFKRDDTITSDAIAEQLAIQSKFRLAKVEQSYMMNFDRASTEWSDIGMSMDQALVDINTAIQNNEFIDIDQFLSQFDGLYATNPNLVISQLKNYVTAAQIKKLEDRLNDFRDKHDNMMRALDASLSNSTPGEKQRYKDKFVSEYNAEIKNMERMLAELRLPNGLARYGDNGLLAMTDDAAQIDNNMWYGNARSEIETQIIEAQAMNARKLDQTLHMRRAFPGIKLYFIEEDANEWLLFDDFYSYGAIKSVDIIESTESASKTAVLKLSNVTGRLNDPLADYSTESILASDTMNEQHVDRMMLRVGCPIMIRMGYDNDPMELEMVFHGAVAELKSGNGEIEIVAQDWGAQLNTPVTGKQESINWWDWRKAHGDVVTWALNKVPGLSHMGKRSIFSTTDDELRKTPGDALYSTLINMVLTAETGDNNPRDDNIYLPYVRSYSPLRRPTFDWRIDAGQTAWQVIQEILLWYPDWICKTMPYEPEPGRLSDQRLTLYVGPAEGYYKWTDKYNDEWQEYNKKVINKSGSTLAPSNQRKRFVTRGMNIYKNSARAMDLLTEITSLLSISDGIDGTMKRINVERNIKACLELLEYLKSPSHYYSKHSYSPPPGESRRLHGMGIIGSHDVGNIFENYVEWISAHFSYKSDPLFGHIDIAREPIDTIAKYYNTGIVEGDCDDIGLLNAYMATAIGIPSYIAVVLGEPGTGHVFSIHKGILLSFYDSNGVPKRTKWFPSNRKANEYIKGLPNKSRGLKFVVTEGFGYLNNTLYHTIGSRTFQELDANYWGSQYLNEQSLFSRGPRYFYVYDIYGNIVYDHNYVKERMQKYGHTRSKRVSPITNSYITPKADTTTETYIDTIPGVERNSYSGAVVDDDPGQVIDPSHRYNFFDSTGKLYKCFKPVTNYHLYDSDHHIIENNITASIDKMSNKVILTYPGGGINPEPIYSSQIDKFDREYHIVADDNIKDDYIKTYVSYQKNIDTNWYANCYAPMSFSKDSSGSMPTDSIPVQMRVANVVLNNQVREMYSGDITVIGDPSVHIWDKVFMYDFVNDMSGPFQVKQVIHHFSPETGFVTKITPMLISHCQNYQSTLNTNYMNFIMAWSLVKGAGHALLGPLSLYGGRAALRYGGRVLGKVMAKTAFTSSIAAGVVGSTAGIILPIASAAIIGWTIFDVARSVGLTYNKELGKLIGRQPINITPLMYYGQPLLAGLEGMRTDDMWVHLHDSVASMKDIPYMLLANPYSGR